MWGGSFQIVECGQSRLMPQDPGLNFCPPISIFIFPQKLEEVSEHKQCHESVEYLKILELSLFFSWNVEAYSLTPCPLFKSHTHCDYNPVYP